MGTRVSGKGGSGLREEKQKRERRTSAQKEQSAGVCSPAGDGECAAKKISYRIAQTGARVAQYRSIYHHRTEYPVKAMCEFFGVSRAAYYVWFKRLEQGDPDQERMQQVQEAYEANHKIYGYRRLSLWLRQHK